MRKITLCADDFGQNDDVSEGILQLVAAKRLSAVSCMTNNDLSKYAKSLAEFTIDIGLHFNLTHGSLLTTLNHQQPFTLKKLLQASFTQTLSVEQIYLELKTQLEQFTNYFNKLPDFIDGHQHIHQFPIIRDALIKVVNELKPKKHIYVRLPVHFDLKNLANLKRYIIFFTGSAGLKQRLDANQIPYNKSFSGIYNFQQAKQFRKYFLKFLREIKEGGVIMCHPGKISKNSQDPLREYRVHEFNYLSSAEFIEDCSEHDIQLSPFVPLQRN